MLDGLIVVKLLEKRDGLINGFRLVNLDGVLPVKLAVKNPVKLPDLKDPVHNGVHTTDACPSLHPGGVGHILNKLNHRDTKYVGHGFSRAYLNSQT